jgi:hypothetical protein
LSELVVKTQVVLPYANGRHVPHKPGDSILLADLSPAMQLRIAENDPRYTELVELRG